MKHLNWQIALMAFALLFASGQSMAASRHGGRNVHVARPGNMMVADNRQGHSNNNHQRHERHMAKKNERHDRRRHHGRGHHHPSPS